MPAAPDLNGKLALVTGASRGIGREVALQMAVAGAHVIAVARTVGGLEELDDKIAAAGGQATLVPLDLKDFAAIDRLGGVIAERWGKLDALVANAGMLGTITPVTQLKAKTFEEVMAVNVTANWRLIRSVDPLLRQAEAGRAIIVSSGVAHNPKAYFGAYAASKAALDMIARVWAAENRKSALRVNLVNPGPTRTHMRAQAMPGEDPGTLPTPADVAAKIVPLAGADITRTGGIFDIPQDRWLDVAEPQ
ncbi:MULTISPECIES: SDR family NAD(P)-dependent oxidoreductase [unclassified Roseitalea]|uniref:SDR family NAD(P)-dependent oxidoreductase n=1 Tax=unclassified Roseitalea TaxID=2639107 RepID=UPI00273D5D75|nr:MULTISPECIES: SDR family NAD(P)-dependent oxidoreductase [unclassified Roseitalea]